MVNVKEKKGNKKNKEKRRLGKEKRENMKRSIKIYKEMVSKLLLGSYTYKSNQTSLFLTLHHNSLLSFLSSKP